MKRGRLKEVEGGWCTLIGEGDWKTREKREREKEERAYARFSRFYIYCKSPTGLSLAVSLWYPPTSQFYASFS